MQSISFYTRKSVHKASKTVSPIHRGDASMKSGGKHTEVQAEAGLHLTLLNAVQFLISHKVTCTSIQMCLTALDPHSCPHMQIMPLHPSKFFWHQSDSSQPQKPDNEVCGYVEIGMLSYMKKIFVLFY